MIVAIAKKNVRYALCLLIGAVLMFIAAPGFAEQTDTETAEAELRALLEIDTQPDSTPLEKLELLMDNSFYLAGVEGVDEAGAEFASEVFGKEEVLFYENQAIALYRLALKAYPESEQAPETQYKIAEIYLKRDQLDTAMAEFEKLIEDYSLWENYRPSHYCDDAQYQIGLIYQAQGKHEEAVEAFYALVDGYTDSDLIQEAYQGIALSMEANNDIDEALAANNKLQELSPDKETLFRTTLRTAKLYTEQDEFDTALQYLQEARQIMPDSLFSDEAEFLIGELYMTREEYDTARIYYYQVIDSYDLNPFGPEAWYKLGLAFYLDGKYGQAVDIFSRIMARQLYPDKQHEILKQLGDCYEQLFLYDRAIAVYRELYDQRDKWVSSQEMVNLHYRIGVCYQGLGDTETAINIYEQIRKSEIDTELAVNVAFRVGSIYRDAGLYDDAITVYRKALLLYPASEQRVTAELAIIDCHRKLGDIPTALRLANVLIHSLNPDKQPDQTFMAVAEKADIYYQLQDYDRAWSVYERLYATYIPEKHRPMIVYRLARCREEVVRYKVSKKTTVSNKLDARYNLAVSLYKEVIEKYADSVWAEQARISLQTLNLAKRLKN